MISQNELDLANERHVATRLFLRFLFNATTDDLRYLSAFMDELDQRRGAFRSTRDLVSAMALEKLELLRPQ